MRTGVQPHGKFQGAVAGGGGLGAAGPADVHGPAQCCPAVLLVLQLAHGVAPETGPGVQYDRDLSGHIGGRDPAQQDCGVRVTRIGERLAALDDAATGNPAAAPDQ